MSEAENENCVAAGVRIDISCEKVDCIKGCAFSADYHDAGKRWIVHALAFEFKLNLTYRFLLA
jgi:hypothetical protein